VNGLVALSPYEFQRPSTVSTDNPFVGQAAASVDNAAPFA